MAAYAGLMSGSSPDADAVTASGGTADSGTPSRAAMICLRRSIVCTSFVSNVPLSEPPEVVVSAGPSTLFDDA
jgi:hypothetical protein